MPRTEDDVVEVIIGPGSGHECKDPEDPQRSARRHGRLHALRRGAGSCCRDNHYRRLSVLSIVCGLSCVGIIALKYSVKAKERQRHDPGRRRLRPKGQKFSIIAIATLFGLVAAVPVLMALISYLATFKD